MTSFMKLYCNSKATKKVKQLSLVKKPYFSSILMLIFVRILNSKTSTNTTNKDILKYSIKYSSHLVKILRI